MRLFPKSGLNIYDDIARNDSHCFNLKYMASSIIPIDVSIFDIWLDTDSALYSDLRFILSIDIMDTYTEYKSAGT